MRLREILTWSPLSTPEVKEIVAHATKFEILQMQIIGAMAGLLFGATMVVFMGWIWPRAENGEWVGFAGLSCLALCVLVLEVIAVRFLARWQLCRTAWAHEHGLQRATLKITRWP